MTKQDDYFNNSVIFLAISIFCQLQMFVIGMTNLLYISIASLLASWYCLNRAKKFQRKEFIDLNEIIDGRKIKEFREKT